MKTHVAFFFTTILLLALPGLAGAAPAIGEQTEQLHREIAALRVVYGLDLGAEQIDELIPLVRTGIGLREDLESVHEKAQRSNLAVLRQVRDDLAEDGELNEETEQAAKDAKKATEKALRPVMWELRDVGEEVMEVLDDDQRQTVMEALSRLPMERGRGQRPTPPRDEESAGNDEGRRQLPPRLEQGVRRHNARKMFGLVFSDEFLAVLQDQI